MTKDEVSVADGATFVVSDSLGDILPSNGHGFFRSDTRFLSGLVVTLDGQRPRPLTAGTTAHHTAKFYSTNPKLGLLEESTLAIVRERRIGQVLQESLSITNHASITADLALDIECQADFADIFEVHSHASSARPPRVRMGRRDFALRFDFRDAGLRWTTLVRTSQVPNITGSTLRFQVRIAPRASWSVDVIVEPYLTQAVSNRTQDFGAREEVSPRPSPLPDPITADLDTRHTTLARAYDRSLRDLRALRVPHPSGHAIPAAGMPWFMAVFGRDSLITALQTLVVDPQLAYGALRALSEYQAVDDDAFRDAEPGKIPHEIRHGRLSHQGRVPHSRYYGTVDATPLYIATLAETVRWCADLELARELLPSAEAAMRWIDVSGDQDGDGFVEYKRRSPQGLENQGWKDSHDSINFSDGRPAVGPIALCEVQGYVYQAKRGLAAIHHSLGNEERAVELQLQAAKLRRHFNDAFWIPETQTYALALDGSKRPVDAVASNMGHCLWSGIIDRERAPLVARRLMSSDMFSGWGIRTLSTEMAAYNPISYHNGSIWPHDNAIIASGLAAYGFRSEASAVVRAILDAATHFPSYRLPELFAGFPRRDDDFPVEYPQANAPQAWAAGAVIMMAQIWFGVSLNGETLRTRPLPGAPSATWRDIEFRGRKVALTTPRKAEATTSRVA